MNVIHPVLAAALAALLALAPPARAQPRGGVEFSGSGFLTLAAGKVFKGDAPQDFNGYNAPIFITDYAQAGIYENGHWSLKPDSRLGLQGTASFTPQLSVTGQVVSRGTYNGKVNLEWIYGSYVINDKLTFQFGRKRLPLNYYSETQDVGFSYPWVHLPSSVYGWEIVNYNGANLLWRDQWGAWSSSMNFFAGGETRKDNGFWKYYNGKDTRTDSRWSNITGADMTLTRDWFETRLAVLSSDIQNRFEDPTLPPPYNYSPKLRQQIYSLAFTIDYRNWMVRNENLYIDRKPMEKDSAMLIGAGYRFGRFLPMVTYSSFKNPLPDAAAAERWATLTLSLRYELTPTSVLKLEVDRWLDRNAAGFNGGVPYGNPRLFSFSYDMVF